MKNKTRNFVIELISELTEKELIKKLINSGWVCGVSVDSVWVREK